jgi:septal ring factor EnvC (AmiA/AmiB activator)
MRQRSGALGSLAALLAACVLSACGHLGSPSEACPRDDAAAELAVYRNAQREQNAHLERELARLRADLRAAEEAMVAIESGLRDVHSRADAVSSLAEAAEAERQLQAGHPGSAVFFASRARRIAETLRAEGRQVASHASARFVRVRQLNLRAGPSTEHPVVTVLNEATPVFPQRRQGEWLLVRTVSGSVGWVHRSLVDPR